MHDRTMVTLTPSTLLHNAVEYRRAYTREAARRATRVLARKLREAQAWMTNQIRPNRPAAG